MSALGRRPFSGLKVLDFSQLIAGPFATYQLALMGADVVKIERREGDATRFWDLSGTSAGRAWQARGLAPSFQALNAGKRSLTLDLHKPEAVAIVHRLVREADVVVENFRPGVMDRLGIGYPALAASQPRLVYGAISAFGQTGPERLGAAYDGKMQAMSGIMAMSGHPSAGPTRAGFALCDVLTGTTAALAIASALYQRARTGEGSLVDVSMLEAALAFLAGPIAEYTLAGATSELRGNKSSLLSATTDVFMTGGGPLLLSVVTDRQFAALAHGLGRADLLADARFESHAGRVQHGTELRAQIEEALAARSAKEWEAILDPAGAPCACIWKVEDVIDHHQVKERGSLFEVDTPEGRGRLTGLGFRFGTDPVTLDGTAPTLGQHTDAILAAAGYATHEVASLRLAEVI